MKKSVIILACLLAAIGARAQVDSRTYSFSLADTNSATVTYAVHGLVESIYIDNAASKTSVVSVTSGEQTLFTLTSTGDANYPLAVPSFTSAGANASNSTQFVEWRKPAVSGNLSVRVAGAADTEGTNSTTVKVIFSK